MTLLPPTPTASEVTFPTGNAVPSGKRIILDDPLWLVLGREGRLALAAYALPRLVMDMKEGLGVMTCEEVIWCEVFDKADVPVGLGESGGIGGS